MRGACLWAEWFPVRQRSCPRRLLDRPRCSRHISRGNLHWLASIEILFPKAPLPSSCKRGNSKMPPSCRRSSGWHRRFIGYSPPHLCLRYQSRNGFQSRQETGPASVISDIRPLLKVNAPIILPKTVFSWHRPCYGCLILWLLPSPASTSVPAILVARLWPMPSQYPLQAIKSYVCSPS